MDKLLEDRDDVRNHVEQHLAILSLIRRFPPEVLGEIFWWTLPSHDSCTQGPWNISRVCARWRAIAVALPALWSRIEIDRKFTIGALRVQLQRSHPHPLKLHIYSERNMHLLRLLLDNSARWESLVLYPNDRMVSTLNEFGGCFPQLRKVDYYADGSSVPCNAFQTASLLTDVAYYGNTYLLPLRYAQLTRLRLRIPQSPDHLRLAQNLIHLTLEGKTALPTPSIPIELPRLRQLFLADGQYLQSLVLPALEDIYLSTHVSSLPPFIDQSSCRLKKLTIAVDVPDIVSILDRAPTLLEMRLSRYSEIDVLLNQLTVKDSDPGTPVVCPRLHLLSFFDVKAGYFEEEYLLAVQMVESRKNSPLCSPIFLSVLNPHARLIPLELKPHMSWLIGGPANEQFQTWRDHYPGQ